MPKADAAQQQFRTPEFIFAETIEVVWASGAGRCGIFRKVIVFSAAIYSDEDGWMDG